MATQSINQVKPLFALGQTVATRGALAAMEQSGISPLALLSRHQRGDWGDLGDEDKDSNQEALAKGFRILSAYRFDTVRLWVITEAGRSTTTILLPEEY
ncbi:hypothetical protein [Methylobacter sp. YRD-M1]|uniref:hypothetical protein n=1 Tax=Methylobacter sp. YRD-M1 TaxID=2911520 RepID=UPI00227D2552|nr:hypothetical protein [Methylobacter sp. YRD-M1]WAK04603.1 hypothetical protein LZ558_22370 [Methylobacter sp. YRD-M1]